MEKTFCVHDKAADLRRVAARFIDIERREFKTTNIEPGHPMKGLRYPMLWEGPVWVECA